MERLMKPFRLRSSKDRKPLSEEQKRKRAGFVVYPLMFLLCLGSFYLIFSPSGQERERQDKGQGFNTEIPSPEDSRLEWNKKDAYEKALMEQESRKRKTFFEAAESMFAKEERKDSVRLPDNIIPERQTNTETETEKGNAGPVSSSAGAYREMNRTLGSIYEPRTDPEKERLLERIEELERMQQQKQEPLSGIIPKGTVLVGGTRIQGERLEIMVNAVEYKGTILPVELEVYDLDGQQGILVPGSLEYDAAREIAANMGTSMNSSINISTDAGAQIASDLGKGVIQGVSQYISKRMRTVKITLKAGHRVLLHSPEK